MAKKHTPRHSISEAVGRACKVERPLIVEAVSVEEMQAALPDIQVTFAILREPEPHG